MASQKKKQSEKSGKPQLTENMVKTLDRLLDWGSPDFDGCDDDEHPTWTFSCDDSERDELYSLLEVLNGIIDDDNKKTKKSEASAKKKTSIQKMDEILEEKRKRGLQGTRIFVDDNPNVTAEQIAEAYCKMENAPKKIVTDKFL